MRNLPQLEQSILGAYENEMKRIVDEEAEAAGRRVVERVRAMAGQIATKVAQHVDFQRLHNQLVITVKIPEKPDAIH